METTDVSHMQVITQDRFGGPEVLYMSERPVPEPRLTEIRVRVAAAGVNPVDQGTRAGRGVADVIGKPPFVLGWEISGVVDAVAPGVTQFAVGDEVFGLPLFPRQAGAYAEFVTAPARHFALKPKSIDHVHAGALAVCGLTAWQAIVDTAAVKPGQRVLVHAASGGVGHLAVQIAKACGAYVIGTARAATHSTLADLGIDEAIDYTTTPFETTVRDVDLAIDLVRDPARRGDYAFRSLDVLRPGGQLVYIPSVSLPEGLDRAASSKKVRATSMLVEPDHAGLEQIAALVDEAALRVLVHDIFPLRDAARAHELGELRRAPGKIVLTV
jgi:NADPH:quinone reductase-like Zn-dependent oxidoreductase